LNYRTLTEDRLKNDSLFIFVSCIQGIGGAPGMPGKSGKPGVSVGYFNFNKFKNFCIRNLKKWG
jgi:hypothetical protein